MLADKRNKFRLFLILCIIAITYIPLRVYADPIVIDNSPFIVASDFYKLSYWLYLEIAVVLVEGVILGFFLKSWGTAFASSFLMNFVSGMLGLGIEKLLYIYILDILLNIIMILLIVLCVISKLPKYFKIAILMPLIFSIIIFVIIDFFSMFGFNSLEFYVFNMARMFLFGFAFALITESMTLKLIFKLKSIWKPILVCNIVSHLMMIALFAVNLIYFKYYIGIFDDVFYNSTIG